MLVAANNLFTQTLSPHSMGLKNDMTIPSPGWDTNPNLQRSTRLWAPPSLQLGWPTNVDTGGRGPNPQGLPSDIGLGRFDPGMSGLTFDGTGLLGTGLFSGDFTTWGPSELIAGAIGAYAVYAIFRQTKQDKVRLAGVAHRRRKSKAVKLRERAKQLEAKEFGSIF